MSNVRKTRPIRPTFLLVSKIDSGAATVDMLAAELDLSRKNVSRICHSLKVMGRITRHGDNLFVNEGIPRLKFTLGRKDIYDPGIEKYGAGFTKRGATGLAAAKPYYGGAIFQSKRDAEVYLIQKGFVDYKIYGVVCYFREDVKYLPNEPYGRLQVERRIVKLPYDGSDL